MLNIRCVSKKLGDKQVPGSGQSAAAGRAASSDWSVRTEPARARCCGSWPASIREDSGCRHLGQRAGL